jgi:uncharacterized protein with NAD-binding domain and iron-sulfur cluster
MPTSQKRRIAILGGGVGSLTTAYLLTNESGWQERYEITVYQMGWRLGGKGACGRNSECGERVEEHGPHVWFGFYETAFQMLNGCYEYCRDNGLTPDSPFQRCIPDAMRAKDDFTLMEFIDGNWQPWNIQLPAHNGDPANPPADLISQLVNAINWLMSVHDDLKNTSGITQPRKVKHASLWTRLLNILYRRAVRVFGGPEVKPFASTPQEAILNRVRELLEHFRRYHPELHVWRYRMLSKLGGSLISHLLDSFLKLVQQDVRLLLEMNDEVRRAWLILDFGVANLRGFFEDGILWNGFEAINRKDYSDWLKQHGCRNPWSPIVQCLYDTLFAFIKGKTASANAGTKPESASLEAGTTLRGALLLFFGYNGSLCYKMQGGMGDTIFTPLYLTLRDRGVKFRFFHEVTNLSVSGGAITTIDINVQGTIKEVLRSADTQYEPLKKVKGLFCWPNEPLYEQLMEGDQIKADKINLESSWSGWLGKPLQLVRGEDFDDVVLGISLGSMRFICKELVSSSSKWRDMIENVLTVQTQSFQLWMNKSARELGWPIDASGQIEIPEQRQYELMGGYIQPIDSWADMSQVLPTEAWGAKSVQYLFGPLEDEGQMPDPGKASKFPEMQLARAKQQMAQFLANSVAPLWPRALEVNDQNSFSWNVLLDPYERTGVERLDAQFCRANVEPSERYVLSIKNSGRYRMDPGASGFINLYLVGDWTRNGLNVGCVEAAALSAKLAAKAIRRG